MRYLKVIAQDRCGNGKADSVLLEFREEVNAREDKLINSALALDINADGKVDFKFGDVTGDGMENALDQRLLQAFANTVIKLNWLNRGTTRKQYLKILAEDLQGDGTPNIVRVHLRREDSFESDGIMISWSAAFDRDNDGKLDFSFHGDANGDGRIDQIDDRLVQRLAGLYLKFNWS
ncbi:hypothetical protein ACIQVE_01065 [Pseudomonas sp. NPDC098747]|uniref:hypothetical protein n=1 Tax=Pseudomonas sp. NPDC098747 TaxID=3364487 RepID=UPI00383BDC71